MEAVIIFLAILLFSVVIHELAHGYMAYWLGDPTAKLAGRLSANPIVHIDPLGSIIVPALMVLSTGAAASAGLGQMFAIGWAKPVPYNPYNLTDQKWGEAKIAFAGPAANLILATVFAGVLALAPVLGLPSTFAELAIQVIYLNVFLALFNLLPLPPLDGSKILPPFLGMISYNLMFQYARFRGILEQNFFLAFIIIIFAVIYVFSAPLQAATFGVTMFLIELFQF